MSLSINTTPIPSTIEDFNSFNKNSLGLNQEVEPSLIKEEEPEYSENNNFKTKSNLFGSIPSPSAEELNMDMFVSKINQNQTGNIKNQDEFDNYDPLQPKVVDIPDKKINDLDSFKPSSAIIKVNDVTNQVNLFGSTQLAIATIPNSDVAAAIEMKSEILLENACVMMTMILVIFIILPI